MTVAPKDRLSGARDVAGPLASIQPVRGAPGYSGSVRGRISDYVYEELGEAIRSLRLEPGAALSEPAVAAWLHVSRAPVREAFTRLADQRLITIVPQVGSRVAPISLRDVADAVFVRSALEKEAFREAIASDRVDTELLQRSIQLNREAFVRADVEAFLETDEQIHLEVFRLAGAPQLWELVRGLKVHLDRLRRLHLGTALSDSTVLIEHQQICDALAARDEAAGMAVIHEHSHRIVSQTDRLRAEFPTYFGA